MVIGNGLIAKAFDSYSEKDNVIIFASGVSNSSISRESNEFAREEKLLRKHLEYKDKKFIYFSTCSISDNSIITPYINHKMMMEDLIKNNHDNYLIFRLPIVIGISNNTKTFFNSLKSKIINKEVITVYENITRYIIDVDDLANLLPTLIDSNDKNQIINICFNNREFVSDIIHKMEKIIGINTNKIYKNDNLPNSDIENLHFVSKLKSINYEFTHDYTKKVLEKYLQ
jgi:nucleoside-diphosphate-sugar epimerase